jgi:hypothetical protein
MNSYGGNKRRAAQQQQQMSGKNGNRRGRRISRTGELAALQGCQIIHTKHTKIGKMYQMTTRSPYLARLFFSFFFSKGFLSIYFSQVYTMTMHVKFSTAMYTFLKTLHHGGIRTRNLLFCSRTR